MPPCYRIRWLILGILKSVGSSPVDLRQATIPLSFPHPHPPVFDTSHPSGFHPFPGAVRPPALPAAPHFEVSPRQFFITEPSFKVEAFNLNISVGENNQADGYLFLDPMFPRAGFGGPQIYDTSGTLIWQGPNNYSSMNLHVCDYLGQNSSHLCWHLRDDKHVIPGAPKRFPPDLNPELISMSTISPQKEFGTHYIMDQAYVPIETIHDVYEGLPINGHVFQMLPGGESLLSLCDSPTLMDLRPYGFEFGALGWVDDQCIVETNLLTKQSIFHWCYLESDLPLWETQTFFRSRLQTANLTEDKAGTGLASWPWDFLHFNSVDKTPLGNYYISFRHGNQIIKVAGPNSPNPGSVLWRLGGRSNSFELKGFPFEIPFSRQHDIRSVSEGNDEEVITLFNNGWDGEGAPSQPYSDGQVIRINTHTMTAELEQTYIHPYKELSGGRGNMQRLPNGNVIIGWGTLSEITEYHKNGTVLYHSNFSNPYSRDHEISYRVYKHDWTGVPVDTPKLVAYSKSCNNSVVAYASWNGATQIHKWRIRTGPSADGPWSEGTTVLKSGFETKTELNSSWSSTAFVLAVALDEHGNSLARVVNQTLMLREGSTLCDSWFCDPIQLFYSPDQFEPWNCPQSNPLPLELLIFVCIAAEVVIVLRWRFARGSQNPAWKH